MKIGELSGLSGVSPRSLRYYEQHELISSVRAPNGYREYEAGAVERASAIHTMFGLGFSRDVVRSVLGCMGSDAVPADHRAAAVTLEQIHVELSSEIDRLAETRDALGAFIAQNAGVSAVR